MSIERIQKGYLFREQMVYKRESVGPLQVLTCVKYPPPFKKGSVQLNLKKNMKRQTDPYGKAMKK